MSRGSHSYKGFKACKAFIISFVVLLILLLIIGVLLRYTSLPERWSYLYILGALCISCFLAGLMVGSIMERGGILFGALAATIFLLIVITISVLITGIQSDQGLFKIRFISCIIAGSIGGMTGVNMKK